MKTSLVGLRECCFTLEIPCLLDVGQCNDSYSAIQIVDTLVKAIDCGVNNLPLSMIISWYEQKAVFVHDRAGVRILTQETQVVKPAQELAKTKPDPTLNAHQDWLEGLADYSVKHVSIC